MAIDQAIENQLIELVNSHGPLARTDRAAAVRPKLKPALVESSRMQYPDGQTAQIGDRVHCWTGCTGTVIADMDGGQYMPGHEAWAYLKAGIMIDTDAAGPIHYTVPEDEMRLLSRTASS